ncbi:MAG: 50S ribosomal protein L1 [Candidatus Levybacteria bacterium]|nr:50S ribosomal protein L1 [Candidatus Levybacteria bacterium]MBI2420978.1 50S ribosomal protein L1 [Candidatus Levybacteria bacterium]
MGKIRVKTLGDEALEEQEKKKDQTKRAEKLSRAKSASGEKSRETADQAVAETLQPPQPEPEASSQKPAAVAKAKKSKFDKTRERSAKYKSAVMEVDKNKTYPLSDALDLLKKVHLADFDETIELHINTLTSGISGQMKLPHGNGKTIKVAIADDVLIAEVEKGKIGFDILLASPSMMSHLAKVAKVLGPKGLMPNPKAGTITDNPEEVAKKFQGGQINYKTEAKTPIVHLVVGKLSFGEDKLSENIKAVFDSIKRENIKNVTLKSTMSPGIKLAV